MTPFEKLARAMEIIVEDTEKWSARGAAPADASLVRHACVTRAELLLSLIGDVKDYLEDLAHPSQGALRMRRLRERRAAQLAASLVRHACVTCDAKTPLPLEGSSPKKGSPQTPLKEYTLSPLIPILDGQEARARESACEDGAKLGTRLSPTWEPTADDRKFAESLELDFAEVFAEFRDYWIAVPGHRGRKINWSATFRNSCRKTAERKRPRGNGSGYSSILAAVSAIRDP